MKASKLYIIALGIIVLVSSIQLNAQISGSSLSEYQLGNIPGTEPGDLSTLYNQINLKYRQKSFKASVRLEQFYTTDSVDRNYLELSQWSINYRHKKLEITAGNFFETLGRGFLFRSYEIPASIKEEKTFRVRHGFYRDIQGASFKYKGKVFRLKAIYGKPLQNTFPPGNELQRTETIEGIQPEIKLGKQNIGLIAMRHSVLGSRTVFSSLFLKGNFLKNFNYYGEYARNMSQSANLLSFEEDNGYAGYFNLNHSYGRYGSSFEVKKFQNFLIGTGVSDPPTLVKEHSYRLLNRSTHVTELLDETGYQMDVFYSFEDGKLLSLNNSRATNKIFDEKFSFNEVFFELYWPFKNKNYIKTYVDYSNDALLRDKNRYALGVYYTHLLKDSWSLTLESEAQQIEPENAIQDNYLNLYLGLIANQGTKLSISIYYEYTSDPVVADRAQTTEREQDRHYYGVGLSYRPNSHNTLSAFAGDRRGGPACVSGICYEVLDFRGLEVRWTTKF